MTELENNIKQHIENMRNLREMIMEIQLIETSNDISHEFKSWLQKIKLKAMFRLNDLT